MTAVLAVITGVLGLAIGSFLNVVVYRVPRHESVLFPASHCPRCDQPIAARHNVPVLGWLLLRGRCASCALPISARYPLVEGATGAAFATVAVILGLSVRLPLALIAIAIVIPVSLIAVDAGRVHEEVAAADEYGSRPSSS